MMMSLVVRSTPLQELMEDFFKYKRKRSRGRCEICFESTQSGITLVPLTEEIVEVIYRVLLFHDNATKEEEEGDDDDKVRKLHSCKKCEKMVTKMTDIFLQWHELSLELRDLRSEVGKQVILGCLGRTPEEWKDWEKNLGNFQTGLSVVRAKKSVPENLTVEEEEEDEIDAKLHKMTPKVVLERVETKKKKIEVIEVDDADPLEVNVKVEEDDSYDVESILEYMSTNSAVYEAHSNNLPKLVEVINNEVRSTQNRLQLSGRLAEATELEGKGHYSEASSPEKQNQHLPQRKTDETPDLLDNSMEEIKLEPIVPEQPDDSFHHFEVNMNHVEEKEVQTQTKLLEDEPQASSSFIVAGRQLRKRRAGQLEAMQIEAKPSSDDDDEDLPSDDDEMSVSSSDNNISSGDDDEDFLVPSEPKVKDDLPVVIAKKEVRKSASNNINKNTRPCPEPECGKQFPDNYKLNRHLQRVHKKELKKEPRPLGNCSLPPRTYNCPVCCAATFPFQRELNVHLQKLHADLLCSFCEFKAESTRHLISHSKELHRDKQKWKRISKRREYSVKCPTCQKSYSCTRRMHEHLESAHGIYSEELHTIFCSHCDLKFTHRWNLAAHKLYSHCVGSLELGHSQCEFCLKFFRIHKNAEEHKQNFHFASKRKDLQGNLMPENIKCFICTESPAFLTAEGLREHESSKEHEEELKSRTSVYCNVCRKSFDKDVEALQAHLKSEEHGKELESLGSFNRAKFCVPCREEFESTEELKKHEQVGLSHEKICREFRGDNWSGVPWRKVRSKNSTEGEGSFMCHACPKVFSQQSILKQHVTKFHSVLGQTCKKCGESFTEWTDFTRHRLTHLTDNNKSVVCDKCGKKYVNRKRLLVHIRTVHGAEESCSCEVCGKEFSARHKLQLHVKGVHERKVSSLECPHCDETFKHEAKFLRIHLSRAHPEIYLKDKPHCCSVCYYNFGMEEELRDHMEKHSNLKCSFCGKFSPHSVHLKVHLRTHTGERPFKCKLCGAEFKTNGNLTNHTKAVHGNDKSRGKKRKKGRSKNDETESDLSD